MPQAIPILRRARLGYGISQTSNTDPVMESQRIGRFELTYELPFSVVP